MAFTDYCLNRFAWATRFLFLLDRPFYERTILCFAHVSFLFFPQLTFSDVCKPTFSKLFHYNLVPAKGRWRSADGKVTAGLVESNGSLPQYTIGLTACTPGSAPGPTLFNEYGKPLPLPLCPYSSHLAFLGHLSPYVDSHTTDFCDDAKPAVTFPARTIQEHSLSLSLGCYSFLILQRIGG